MASTGKSPYIEVAIDCPKCQTKQILHVVARAGFKQMSDQFVDCVNCKESFPVMVPDTIIAGPFAS